MVWHLSLDRHRESILVAFADLLASPAPRRALAQRDIAAGYRMLCDAGISQVSMRTAGVAMNPPVTRSDPGNTS
jgi:hypothetical protein